MSSVPPPSHPWVLSVGPARAPRGAAGISGGRGAHVWGSASHLHVRSLQSPNQKVPGRPPGGRLDQICMDPSGLSSSQIPRPAFIALARFYKGSFPSLLCDAFLALKKSSVEQLICLWLIRIVPGIWRGREPRTNVYTRHR